MPSLVTLRSNLSVSVEPVKVSMTAQPLAWELAAKEQRRKRRFSKKIGSALWTSVVSEKVEG